MKKLILGALATAMIASPLATSLASAQDYGRRTTTTVRERPNGRTVVTQRTVDRQAGDRQGFRSWQRGQRFDRRHAQNYRELDYRQYRGRHLYAPPRGYHWVRSGNDAVLVAVTSGIIGAVLAGALR
jgi:Ni/Co efflux regulator RcnB